EAASNQLRGRALATINDAVITVDNDGRITWMNGAAERQYQASLENAIGHPLSTLFDSRWLEPDNAATASKALRQSGQWRGEQIHVASDGHETHVETAIIVLYDDANQPHGKLLTMR